MIWDCHLKLSDLFSVSNWKIIKKKQIHHDKATKKEKSLKRKIFLNILYWKIHNRLSYSVAKSQSFEDKVKYYVLNHHDEAYVYLGFILPHKGTCYICLHVNMSVQPYKDTCIWNNFMDIRNFIYKFPWAVDPSQKLPHYSNWVKRQIYQLSPQKQ